MADVLVYSGPNCPFCDMAKGLLRRKGVAFQEINVRADPAKRDEMIQRSGGRMTIPQIFINGQYVGDCDGIHKLDAAGKLDALLNA